jgi:drug/metabolite transporter (DMT)-like permease
MNGLVRYLVADLHPFQIAFFRNLFGLAVLLPLLLRAGRGALRTQKLSLHGLRGLLNAAAMLTFFYALGITPLATVAALSFTTPLFATLLAMLLLKEAVGPRRAMGVLLGFAGALIILRPGFEALTLGPALALLSSCCWAAALIDIKVLSRTESSLTITFYAALFLTPITGIAALPFWSWPNPAHWGLLVLAGALGSLGQMSLAHAFHHAEATQVLPADFTKLIWAALIGWLAFAEVPDIWTLLGGSVIFGSVVYVAYREARIRSLQPA